MHHLYDVVHMQELPTVQEHSALPTPRTFTNATKEINTVQCPAYGHVAMPEVGGADETGGYEVTMPYTAENTNMTQWPAYRPLDVGGADQTGGYEVTIPYTAENTNMTQCLADRPLDVGGADQTGGYEVTIPYTAENTNMTQCLADRPLDVDGADQTGGYEVTIPYTEKERIHLTRCPAYGSVARPEVGGAD